VPALQNPLEEQAPKIRKEELTQQGKQIAADLPIATVGANGKVCYRLSSVRRMNRRSSGTVTVLRLSGPKIM
jgi:hypothetical protein